MCSSARRLPQSPKSGRYRKRIPWESAHRRSLGMSGCPPGRATYTAYGRSTGSHDAPLKASKSAEASSPQWRSTRKAQSGRLLNPCKKRSAAGECPTNQMGRACAESFHLRRNRASATARQTPAKRANNPKCSNQNHRENIVNFSATRSNAVKAMWTPRLRSNGSMVSFQPQWGSQACIGPRAKKPQTKACTKPICT